MFTYKTTIVIKNDYYDKNNCRFVLCESCWWFATILKDIFKFSNCPICKKTVYVERIIR